MAPDVVWLDERAAVDRRITCAKAANLALAEQIGLPVFDGFVITTLGTSALDQPDRVRPGTVGVARPIRLRPPPSAVGTHSSTP